MVSETGEVIDTFATCCWRIPEAYGAKRGGMANMVWLGGDGMVRACFGCVLTGSWAAALGVV